jgi:hypothetical protein
VTRVKALGTPKGKSGILNSAAVPPSLGTITGPPCTGCGTNFPPLTAVPSAADKTCIFPPFTRGCYEPGKGSRSGEKGCSARRGAPRRVGPCASGLGVPPQRRNAPGAPSPSRPNPKGSPGNRPPAVLARGRLALLAVVAGAPSPLRRVVAPSIRPVPGAARPLPWFITPSRDMAISSISLLCEVIFSSASVCLSTRPTGSLSRVYDPTGRGQSIRIFTLRLSRLIHHMLHGVLELSPPQPI